jgi:hypothetical protein
VPVDFSTSKENNVIKTKPFTVMAFILAIGFGSFWAWGAAQPDPKEEALRKKKHEEERQKLGIDKFIVELALKNENLEKKLNALKIEVETRVPLGAMLPHFGAELPSGFVWADGQSDWPKADWVPKHLREKKVPDMRQHLLGGAPQPSDVGVVWNKGMIPEQPVNLKPKDGLVPPGRFPTQNVMAMVNSKTLGEDGAEEIVENGRTWVRIPAKYYGDDGANITVPKTELNSAEKNPRHVMCRWIIRIL